MKNEIMQSQGGIKMNLHAVYFSPTKTTKKVVKAISKGIGENTKDYDITLPKNRKGSLEFSKEDCLVVGLPVYGGRIPALIEEFLLGLKGHNTPIILVAVYGNRDYDDALLEMKDMFDKQGFISVAAGAFIGEHSYTGKVATSRPDSSDLVVCETFGKIVKELLNRETLDGLVLDVKGFRPYRERKKPAPVGPTVNKSCINCGTCVSNCPTGALTLEGEVRVNEELCVRCHACTKNCPVNAIEFDNRIAHIKNWLEETCSLRKEPELFYSTPKDSLSTLNSGCNSLQGASRKPCC